MKLDDISTSFEAKSPFQKIDEFIRTPENKPWLDVLLAVRDGFVIQDTILPELELKLAEFTFLLKTLEPLMIKADRRKAVAPLIIRTVYSLTLEAEVTIREWLDEFPNERPFRERCTKEEIQLFCDQHLLLVETYNDLLANDLSKDKLILSIPLAMNRKQTFKVKSWFGQVDTQARFDIFKSKMEQLQKIRLVKELPDGKLRLDPILRVMIIMCWKRMKPASQEKLARFKKKIERML